MKRPRSSSTESDQAVVEVKTEVQLSAKDKAYETVIATLRKRISELTSELESQPASHDSMRKLQDENDKLRAKVDQLESRINSETDKARSEMKKLRDHVSFCEDKIRLLTRENSELTSLNESNQHKLASAIQESNLQTNLRQRLRENYDNLVREYERATERGDLFVQKIYTLQGELERMESTKRELVEELNRLTGDNVSSEFI